MCEVPVHDRACNAAVSDHLVIIVVVVVIVIKSLLQVLLFVCEVPVHDRACNAAVSDHLLGLHCCNAGAVCRLWEGTTPQRGRLDSHLTFSYLTSCSRWSADSEIWCLSLKQTYHMVSTYSLNCHDGSLSYTVQNKEKKKKQNLFIKFCNSITIATKTDTLTGILPGRVYTHQCWPPMTNHM